MMLLNTDQERREATHKHHKKSNKIANRSRQKQRAAWMLEDAEDQISHYLQEVA